MFTYIRRDVLDLEFPLAGGQGRALLELWLPEQPVDTDNVTGFSNSDSVQIPLDLVTLPVDDSKSENVADIRAPFDDDGVVLLVGVCKSKKCFFTWDVLVLRGGIQKSRSKRENQFHNGIGFVDEPKVELLIAMLSPRSKVLCKC